MGKKEERKENHVNKRLSTQHTTPHTFSQLPLCLRTSEGNLPLAVSTRWGPRGRGQQLLLQLLLQVESRASLIGQLVQVPHSLRWKQNNRILSISLPFEFPGPASRKFIVCTGHRLQCKMPNCTNHKFPLYEFKRK